MSDLPGKYNPGFQDEVTSSSTSSTKDNIETSITKSTISAAVDLKEQDHDDYIEPPDSHEDHNGAELNTPDVDSDKREGTATTTEIQTLIHLLKGNIGTGLLAMPEAFMYAGLWVGFFGIPVMGIICIHCMHLLLDSSRTLCKRGKLASLSYEDTAEMSFKLGPERLRKWSGVFRTIITVFLMITQLGFCCVYVVFVAQNIHQAIQCMTGSDALNQQAYMAIVMVPILLLCYIPNLKSLAPVSMIAGAIQVASLGIIYYYLVRDLPGVVEEVPGAAGWSKLPLYFGNAIYAFEGIGLVLPLENKMKYPKAFKGIFGILNTGMVIVVCFYASMGFYGYLRYGSTVLGSITLNLPGDEVLSQVVKLTMSAAIFLTYPLQFYVPLSIIRPWLERKFDTKKKKIMVDYGIRTVLVLLTYGLAAAIPNIGLFITLVGAVSSSTLALIFPPMIHIITHWPDTGKYNYIIVKAVLIMLFGFLGFLVGSISSIQAIIEFFQDGGKEPAFEC